MSASITISSIDIADLEVKAEKFKANGVGEDCIYSVLRCGDDRLAMFLSLAKLDEIVAELLKARAEFVRTAQAQEKAA